MAIIEDYCSFETSKLLKEKGFDAELKIYWSMGMFDIPILHCCPQHLVDDGEEPMPIEIDNSGIECTSRSNPWKPEEFECIAPTLQMAMKWLREVHNCSIEITSNGYLMDNDATWECDIKFKHRLYFRHIQCKKSYEDCAEAGIKYCLEHLI